jgi:hypothetical protein
MRIRCFRVDVSKVSDPNNGMISIFKGNTPVLTIGLMSVLRY